MAINQEGWCNAPYKQGFPLRSCINLSIAGSKYCAEHQNLENEESLKGSPIEITIGEVDLSKRLSFSALSDDHNDLVDASALAWSSLIKPKSPNHSDLMVKLTFFILGLGAGLFLSYMTFLFFWMN